ncbi:MAG: prepilin peptidase [Phycisphaerae bacterium]|nr:prepilin peptidase [Phycisphaerae bacterium]
MHIIWIIFLIAIGASVGSFLNVVIWRMPRGESIVFPGSHCPSCGRAIKWYDNIPLVSWLALRGKCRFCKVSISPRYLLVEAATALLVVGLYACYYIWHVRSGIQPFDASWPMFLAHAALLCGLLACSVIDIETWQVPLEICWFVSLVGLAVSTIRPDSMLISPVSQPAGAMCLCAGLGLVVAIFLQKYGIILPSFIDADMRCEQEDAAEDKNEAGDEAKKPAPISVAFTSAHGINPRVEILREVLFLTPAILGAIGGYLLVTRCDAAGRAWANLYSLAGGQVGGHLNGFFASLFGYLIGGLWIWGIRILGTLGFGKEAMGLGDVHILAAAGAVCGWMVPSMAFFLAPIFGLAWAIILLMRKGQRELPYGPWLGVAVFVAMIFYDQLLTLFERYTDTMRMLTK